jgi:hypothetical protein
LTHVNEKVVIQFIEQQLITRFGVPSVLVFYNAAYFSSTLLTEFSLDKGIIIRYSANNYPQGNGVAESTNKNLVRILKKTVADNQRNWHNSLHNALWEDRVTPKEASMEFPILFGIRTGSHSPERDLSSISSIFSGFQRTTFISHTIKN